MHITQYITISNENKIEHRKETIFPYRSNIHQSFISDLQIHFSPFQPSPLKTLHAQVLPLLITITNHKQITPSTDIRRCGEKPNSTALVSVEEPILIKNKINNNLEIYKRVDLQREKEKVVYKQFQYQ